MSTPVLHWFLPSAGDGRHVGAVTAVQARSQASTLRRPDVDYLGQVGRAAEQSGFVGALTPTGAGCEDAWLLCAALAQVTTNLEFLVAFRPGFILPTLAAQQAATFQHLSGNRLRINVVTGGDPVEQRAFGDFLDHDERYERTDEFLSVLRSSWLGAQFDHDGHHYRVEGGGLRRPLHHAPPIYFGGASPAAEKVAARHADVYLTWGEPPAMVAERLTRMRNLAADAGRELRFGIRLHVIPRDTEAEAWREAKRLLDGMDPGAIRASQERFARMDSTGQARMTALHGGSSDELEISPNLWAGIGLVREGAATALVGSHEQVAERILEYHALGFDELILSGYPHLEEAYRFGECVRPLLDGQVLVRDVVAESERQGLEGGRDAQAVQLP
jgi:alkanesulfonate monooxygenase